jgi:hypothetical protein
MKTTWGVVLAAVCAATVSVAAQKQIALLVTVTDPGGSEVTTLEAKDVRVLENGAEATVTKVEPVNRVPKVQILIDNGIGMPAESLGDLRTALRDLLTALPPGLEITLVTTAPQPRFLERATTDRAKLLEALGRLSPDSGAGRFVESLFEANDRIVKDKTPDASYTIISIGTTSGDSQVRESDVKTLMERVQQRHTTVHAIILSRVGASASGGTVQLDVAQAVAGMSGGRYENLAVANRLVTLLKEIGGQVATTLGSASRQFRVTVNGASGGAVGGLSLGVAGKAVTSVQLDQR